MGQKVGTGWQLDYLPQNSHALGVPGSPDWGTAVLNGTHQFFVGSEWSGKISGDLQVF